MRKIIKYLFLCLTITFAATPLFPAQQIKWPHDEFIQATNQKPYAPDIEFFEDIYHFKKAKVISAGELFTITSKTEEWNQKVEKIKQNLKAMDAVRNKHKKPFKEKLRIENRIERIKRQIQALPETDVRRFTRLTSRKRALELQIVGIQSRIDNQAIPKLNPLKETYKKLETELFLLFNEVAKEK